MKEFILNLILLILNSFFFYIGWNLFCAKVLNLKEINYLQAMGFVILVMTIRDIIIL